MRPTVLILIFTLTLFCTVCRTGIILERKGTKKNKEYEIGYDYGCCGCTTFWYSIFKNRLMSEQFVFETVCGMGSPTVFRFTSDLDGKIQNIKRYIAVSDSTATYNFDSSEKRLLVK